MFISQIPFSGPIKPILLDNKPIKCVSSSSCLGIILDNKLSWTHHIQPIVPTFNAKITKLREMKTFDQSTPKSTYVKAVLQSATYCTSL